MHDLARWIGTWLWIPVYRLHVHGRERIPATGPVVVVANHSAFIDGPLLFGLFRRRTVFWVKQEMFTGPLGWALSRIGQIPVRRGARRVDCRGAAPVESTRALRCVQCGYDLTQHRVGDSCPECGVRIEPASVGPQPFRFTSR